MSTVPAKILMSSDEASRALGIPKRTLSRMASEGTIPARRVGKLWKFPVDRVHEWIASDQKKAAS